LAESESPTAPCVTDAGDEQSIRLEGCADLIEQCVLLGKWNVVHYIEQGDGVKPLQIGLAHVTACQ
jgi:hypothetical protein